MAPLVPVALGILTLAGAYDGTDEVGLTTTPTDITMECKDNDTAVEARLRAALQVSNCHAAAYLCNDSWSAEWMHDVCCITCSAPLAADDDDEPSARCHDWGADCCASDSWGEPQACKGGYLAVPDPDCKRTGDEDCPTEGCYSCLLAPCNRSEPSNVYTCGCGRTTCAGNEQCSVDSSECLLPRCSNVTNGLSGTYPCACGTAACARGERCMLATSTCATVEARGLALAMPRALAMPTARSTLESCVGPKETGFSMDGTCKCGGKECGPGEWCHDTRRGRRRRTCVKCRESGCPEENDVSTIVVCPWVETITGIACDTVTEVIIPNGVRYIDYEAFKDYKSLAEVTIGDSVLSVAGSAFANCVSLARVTIGNSVEIIYRWAFCDCFALANLTIGSSVTRIHPFAFSHCGEDSEYVKVRAPNSLAEVHIPDSVVQIDHHAFYRSPVHTLTLGKSIQDIGNAVFDECCNLSTIIVRCSDFKAWVPGCASVLNVTVEATGSASRSMMQDNRSCNVTTLTYRGTDISPGAWKSCQYLSTLVFGDSVNIGREAFQGIDGITSLDLSPVLTIGADAFSNCTALTSVSLGSKVEYIGSGAFSGCGEIVSVDIPSPLPGPKDFFDVFSCDSVTHVRFIESVGSIVANALSGCLSVLSVTTTTASTIGFHAFSGCTRLREVDLGAGVVHIDDYAFSDCTALTSVNLPATVKEIGRHAFEGCISLAEVTHANRANLGVIRDYALAGCSLLRSAGFGEAASFIGRNAFSGCSQLTDFNFTGKLTTIKKHTFSHCTSLGSVYFPEVLTSIGSNAFKGCLSLTNLSIPHTVQSIGDSAFEGCSSLGDSVEIPPSVAIIGDGAFIDTGLLRVSIFPPFPAYGAAFPQGCSLSPCGDTFEVGVQNTSFGQRLSCVCRAGQRFDAERHQCVDCPSLLLACPGGHPASEAGVDVTVSVKEGYMTLPGDAFSVYSCADTKSCPGERSVQSSSMCAAGLDVSKPRCAVCISDPPHYQNSGGGCSPCSAGHASGSIFLFLRLAGFLSFQLAFTYWLYTTSDGKAPKEGDGTKSAIIETLQYQQALIRLDLQYPASIKAVKSILDTVTIPTVLRVVEFRVECAVGNAFVYHVVRQALSPLMLFANILVLHILHRAFGRRLDWDSVHNMVGRVATGLFLTVVDLSLSLFYTIQMPNGKLMLVHFPEVVYGSSEWMGAVPINLLAFLVYGATTLTYVLHAVWTAPRRAATEPNFMKRFSFCFDAVREQYWWWILVQLSARVSLNLLQLIFPASSVHSQIYTALICLFGFTMLQFNCRPFKFIGDTSVDLTFKLILIVCLILMTSFIDQRFLNHSNLHDMNNQWGIILICICALGFAFAVWKLLKVMALRRLPVTGKRVNGIEAAWKFRDVALAMLLVPDEEFDAKTNAMSEYDQQSLQEAMQSVIQLIFGHQTSNIWRDQRLMVGGGYKVWQHSAWVRRTLDEVRSGRFSAAVEKTCNTRRTILDIAAAWHKQAQAVSKAHALNTPSDSHVLPYSRFKRALGLPCAASITREDLKTMLDGLGDVTISDEDADTIFAIMSADGSHEVTIEDFTQLLDALAPMDYITLEQDAAASGDPQQGTPPVEPQQEAQQKTDEEFDEAEVQSI